MNYILYVIQNSEIYYHYVSKFNNIKALTHKENVWVGEGAAALA